MNTSHDTAPRSDLNRMTDIALDMAGLIANLVLLYKEGRHDEVLAVVGEVADDLGPVDPVKGA